MSVCTAALWAGVVMTASLQNSGDTIFALSSAPGRAGVAVFRVSGLEADVALERLTQRALPPIREARTRRLYHRGEPLDMALVLRLPGPGSFTGEDVVEIMTHGSPAVVEGLAEALLAAGLRQAEPGEFTRRAFLNGRMDLLEAEGLADLIDADTEAQRKQALRQMEGGLSARAEGWKDRILDALAQVEGEIDFPDEADVPDRLSKEAGPGLVALADDLRTALDQFGRGERVREGLRIAVIGAPNAGKSSLINALAGREAAIVTDIPGTTRDVVEVQLDIAGLPVRVADTAGLRDTDDVVEREGVRRARLNAREADIRILVVDSTAPQPDGSEHLERDDLVLLNKTDIGRSHAKAPIPEAVAHADAIATSLVDGSGLEEVLSWLEREVAARYSPTRSAGLTRARHRDIVVRALDAVERARANLDVAPELAGEDLRGALLAMDELAGRADMEAVLDRVFSRFCIGK